MGDVLFETAGRAGHIVLNRPKALNALSKAMCLEISAALEEWARDDRVERVVIRGEGKAFCAGGDIRSIYEDRDSAPDFFRAEYQLDHRVAHFQKPYIALIDGIVMGGGVGVSLHGSHRLAGEHVLFAMPEIGIGLFPDVGARHLLARLPDEMGTYLGLTGARLQRDTLVTLGLATHALASERLVDALDRVAHARDLDGALEELAQTPDRVPPADREMIRTVFSGDDPMEILERAETAANDHAIAAAAATAMRAGSPTSIAVTLAALRRASDEDIDETFRTDYRIVRRILEGHDLYEGIRAVVIDKDKSPRWSPASLDGVDAQSVAAHFIVPDDGDLRLGTAEST